MKRALAVLALAALAASPAASKTIHGVTVSKDGTVSVPNWTGTYVAPPPHVEGAHVIYSNIARKYPQGLYFCCSGATVAGPTSALNMQDWAAIQFTPSADATVQEIDVPVQKIAGTATVNFGLYTDEGGLPGTLLMQFQATGFGLIGSCCNLAVGKNRKGVPVKGGTPYWVALTTDSSAPDAFANWPTNSSDIIDLLPTAVNQGSGWTSFPYNAMAFAVYGH
jgi:hypothetical protein